MVKTGGHEITRLLRAWKGGNEEALRRLSKLVYDRLSRLAGSYLQHE